MPPDLNSLPPSPSRSSPGGSPRLTNIRRAPHQGATDTPPSPRSPAQNNLHATAAINAGLQRNNSSTGRPSMSPARRRSSVITGLTLSNLDGAGSAGPQPQSQPRSPLMNTADPHHQRTPSLGQIHQQLENEQEAQVNRLLQMIRLQQDQLASLQSQHQEGSANTDASSAIDTASTTPPVDTAQARAISASRSPSMPRSPLQRPMSISRQSSHGTRAMHGQTSNASSPSLRPLSTTRSHDDWSAGGVRDDSTFYQAETHTLQRENQMLKQRIRELERQLNDTSKPGSDAPDGA